MGQGIIAICRDLDSKNSSKKKFYGEPKFLSLTNMYDNSLQKCDRQITCQLKKVLPQVSVYDENQASKLSFNFTNFYSILSNQVQGKYNSRIKPPPAITKIEKLIYFSRFQNFTSSKLHGVRFMSGKSSPGRALHA